jgi:hypothetical protein
MGGSQVITEPAPISWQEITAWSQATGRRPNPWEAQQIATMDTVWLNTTNNGQGTQRYDQSRGEYCQQKHIEECLKKVGGNEDVLKQVCSTCPN